MARLQLFQYQSHNPIKMSTELKPINHGAGIIDLTGHGTVIEMMPTELHMKSNGRKDDTPSFAILLEKDNGYLGKLKVVGQFSLATLKEVMDVLGYKIIPHGEEGC